MKQLKSKLIPDEFWIQEVRSGSIEPNRRLGTSTGVALKTIGTAMLNPGEWVEVDAESNDNILIVRTYIKNMLDKLKLKYFLFRKIQGKLFLKYDIFEDVPFEVLN